MEEDATVMEIHSTIIDDNGNHPENIESDDSEEDYAEREAGIVITAGKLTESVKRTPFTKSQGKSYFIALLKRD